MGKVSDYPCAINSWQTPHLRKNLVSVFIFTISTIVLLSYLQICDGSSGYSSPIVSNSNYRRPRQIGGFGGFGAAFNSLLQPQPYRQRQQNSDVSFFQSMMSLNFDMTEVLAMYRNVTAVAVTPGCFGQCRTPMALYMIQSFYPCHNLQKVDCPKGLVCCVQETSTRLASVNSIHDTRIKATPPISSDETGEDDRYNVPLPQRYTIGTQTASASTHSALKAKPDDDGPHASNRPSFDEEYYKNNFIQDEIPER